MIKILVIDQDNLMRHGLQVMLQGEQQIKIHVTEPIMERLHKEISVFQPDIAIIPVSDTETGALETIHSLKKNYPGIKILLLMSAYEELFIAEGLKAGVEGFLLDENNISQEQLVMNIQQLYDGKYVLTGKIATLAMLHVQDTYEQEKQVLNHRLSKQHINISWRELDILYLLMKNRKNHEMAASLHLSEKTIRDYVSRSYRKIGIHRRQEAIVYLKRIMNDHVPLENDNDP